MGSSNVTISASWNVINYTITYNLNGGSGNNPTSYNIDTTTFTLTNPTKTGYTFNGWTGSNGSSPQTSVTISKGSQGDKTYTANWTAKSYTITYNCNGGSGSTASSSHTYDVAKNLSNNGCYKIAEGTNGMIYYMAGWSTSSSATAATYTNGQSVTNINNGSNTTLYAVWKNLFSYSGSYSVLSDGSGNWRIKFLASGTLTFNSSGNAVNLDVFCGGGGGGGYTKTSKGVTANAGTAYSVTIGSGDTPSYAQQTAAGSGGTTSALGVSAAGGYGGYSGGGGGAGATKNAAGGAGGGGNFYWNSGTGYGGSGIVVIRNHR